MAPSAAVPCDDAGRELPHVAIFPFMARGHTIPLTHLAHLLLRRRLATVTFFTTPGNAAFVCAALPDGVDVVELPFPDGDGHASQGAENVEGVASASSFATFAEATSALRPRFEEALAAMRPPATLLVADAFLYWTGESAGALGVPRLSFLGTSAFAHVMREAFVRDKPGCGPPQCDTTGGATGTYTLKEVARGLEEAEVNFLWAVRSDDSADLGIGFHERVQGRGMVTGGWVDQPAILQHDCVRGFLSHCGWNSVLESVCAGVPLAVWPMVFDQPLNAKLVVDELKVGVRVRSTGGLVKGEEVSRAVREIMLGETRVSAAKNAAVLAGQAQHAMSAGGSSWKMVEEMISELSGQPTDKASRAHVGGK
ncbi:unnamed protein product [Triticum turgidum subsp. durum]|uniref:Glycosyltransferase n=1 Tax=Triticum turgidum subsp. durum TaxID=4567 RepID=A0A9R0X8K1_TRITD|nr:unnamed protein product [Triticum turgidum subsp. durum]